MNYISKPLLVALAVFEAIIIAALIAHRTHYVVKADVQPITITQSPIDLAAEYDAPEAKFEDVVKKNRGWLQYRAWEHDVTTLAKCALAKQTNYVRILIQNGASVNIALKDVSGSGAPGAEAAALIRKIEAESKASQTSKG